MVKYIDVAPAETFAIIVFRSGWAMKCIFKKKKFIYFKKTFFLASSFVSFPLPSRRFFVPWSNF